MAVERWDPGRPAVLTADKLARLEAAAGQVDQPRFGLDDAAAAELAPIVRHAVRPGQGVDWAQAAADLGDDELVSLIRLFTLAESVLPGWEAGDASPVIPLAALLKRRGGYPEGLTAWIRAHSDNRFLPYGNLLHRL